MKILFISLGCDKNLVDSERMLGLLEQEHFTMTDSETEADVIVVNTCCFIGDAQGRKYPEYSGNGRVPQARSMQGPDRYRLPSPALPSGGHR